MKLKRKINYFLKYVLFRKKRLFNLILIEVSKKLKLTRVLGYPPTLMIEPTNICNLKCPLCPTGAGLIKRKKGFMTLQDFKKIIDEMQDYIIHLRLWNWGEPLLNPEIFDMISYAEQKKIFVNLSTNSNFLDKDTSKKLIDSGLDELIISLDGASEETYCKYRKGGDFKKIIDSLKFLIEEKKQLNKKTPYIKLQFIIMKHNQHEIERIKKLAGELGIDQLVFKTVGVMDYFSKEDIKKYLPDKEEHSRYAFKGNELVLKRKIKNWCDFLWEEMIINWDGEVVPCCFDMNNLHVLGNAFKQGVKKIWNNKEYIDFRKKILQNKKEIILCKGCPGTNKETFIEL
ncbi:SPASM domain-containing protein [Candidatus Pacearchaeota archaeon]|nr:SPASM domain-containing protein [Candidatus Pacearchaeota archaeon]